MVKNFSLSLANGDGDEFTKTFPHLQIEAIYSQGKSKSQYLTL